MQHIVGSFFVKMVIEVSVLEVVGEDSTSLVAATNLQYIVPNI